MYGTWIEAGFITAIVVVGFFALWMAWEGFTGRRTPRLDESPNFWVRTAWWGFVAIFATVIVVNFAEPGAGVGAMLAGIAISIFLVFVATKLTNIAKHLLRPSHRDSTPDRHGDI